MNKTNKINSKIQQMKMMKIEIKKLFDNDISDEYIITTWAGQLHFPDISTNDIENILKDLHIEKQIISEFFQDK